MKTSRITLLGEDALRLRAIARSLTVRKELNTDAIKHGRKYGSVAITEYVNKTGQTVISSGIQIDSNYPYLAGSPDGLVGKDGVVEIKCPYTSKEKLIDPINVPYLYENEHGENHDYFYQIMGTLMCTGRRWCDLVIWTTVDCKIIRIDIDTQFIDTMVDSLKAFFESHFKQAILDIFTNMLVIISTLQSNV